MRAGPARGYRPRRNGSMRRQRVRHRAISRMPAFTTPTWRVAMGCLSVSATPGNGHSRAMRLTRGFGCPPVPWASTTASLWSISTSCEGALASRQKTMFAPATATSCPPPHVGSSPVYVWRRMLRVVSSCHVEIRRRSIIHRSAISPTTLPGQFQTISEPRRQAAEV